ncbi:hypothetical protein [uncultured Thiocystis sp.]|jgi:hypothetical protein|uniref:hypothetical protein n=1 Tax=uncultured Thiocystis sp. TaxID=1202134 RepID=UPI0025ECB495|nr:hypothetical protein [uncultured Thiocystis sp.]
MKKWLGYLFALIASLGLQPSAVAQTQPTSPPELLLVYWSSVDCPFCKFWESESSGMQSSLKNSEEFKKLAYRVVKNKSIQDPYVEEDFPTDIRWIKERINRGEEKPLGKPGWGFYVDRVRIAKFYGTKNWYEKNLPEIKRLVAKYSGNQ